MSLENIANRMAECALLIKSIIDSHGAGEDISDLAAQGIVYGLLNAKITGVVKQDVVELLDGFLGDGNFLDRLRRARIFSSGDFLHINAEISRATSALAEFMKYVDLERDLKKNELSGSLDDAISNIHERFLRMYAPREKSKRGVFYTPNPVARFIVRMVDALLKEKLGFVDGLADGSIVDGRAGIQVLDPATGTGTFLLHVLDHLEKHACQRIPRVVGIDLMPVPLALAQMRCALRIMDSRKFKTKQICPAFIEGNAFEQDPAFLDGFSIIIGNPPYSRASQNKITRIDTLLGAYKEGVRGDKNIQALSDDYIKFIRFGQDIIDRNGFGILGFVVNHTFLKGPIFRGMRRSLLASFDELYILDLHGNAKIQEDVPSGIVNQNIFPIQQGTCIFIALKARNGTTRRHVIYHHEIFGTKGEKLAWLDANDLHSIPWHLIEHPREPLLAFSPEKADDTVLDEYCSFTSIEDILKFHSVGGKPGDDELLVSFDRDSSMRKIKAFFLQASKDTEMHRLTEAKRKILRNAPSLWVDARQVIRYNYRPFDVRFVYFDRRAWTRPVIKAKQQCYEGNLILLTTKLVKDRDFHHVFVANAFTDVIFLSNTSSTNCYLFPVRVIASDGTTSWNLSRLYQDYSSRMGAPLDENDLPGTIGYIYAILWSPSFKRKFNACLKGGTPRVPLVEDKVFFGELRALGRALILLHLLELEKDSFNSACGIEGTGSNTVEKMHGSRFHDERLHINTRRYFFPIHEDVYDFHVGKYAVLRKWLDDRIGKTLEASDIRHFQAMVRAIDLSNDIIAKIDKIVAARLNIGS
ncbi:MAG: type ISP restriction/modification enzyme [Candidatus Sigynarchaeota archaeon]